MTDTKGLLAAMLAVQAAAPTLEKDRAVTVKTKTGGEYTYSYTPLDSIVEKVGPLMHENGLVWICKPSWREGLGPTLKYKLAHAPSGESEEDEMPLMLPDEDVGAQEQGSAITYARRYALVSVLGLVADADDDGALANSGRGGRGAGRPASEKQIGFVKKLLKQRKATVLEIRAMLKGAGVTVAEDADVAPLIDKLTGPQASELIEFLKDGKPVPTGGSDVPSAAAGEFEHERQVGDTTFEATGIDGQPVTVGPGGAE